MQHHTAPGLYIHVPFCRSKCPYCAFFSVVSQKLVPRWVEALKKEVLLYKGRFQPFDTLYFGGGTPTLLPNGALAEIVEHVFSSLDILPGSEMTIEANPCDLNTGKIRALKAMGFNRVSMGVQAFDDETLRFLGRRHNTAQTEKAILDLRSAGIENISLDLIYGFRNQSRKKWVETLKRAVFFQPEHLSCYQLTIEDNTPFQKRTANGTLHPLDDAEEGAYFRITSGFLEKHGYEHYEVSSFSRGKDHVSRHNRKYWAHTPYLGLGPSAHSFLNAGRWWNVRSVKAYCEALESGRLPVEGSEQLTQEQLRFESIFLGLRNTEGFEVSGMSSRTYHTLCDFEAAGMVRLDKGKAVSTRKGLMMADHLACCLGS